MRFVYSGPYIQFRGYVFAHGKPTNVTDVATIAALEKLPNFRKVPDEPKEAKATPVLKRPTLTARRR